MTIIDDRIIDGDLGMEHFFVCKEDIGKPLSSVLAMNMQYLNPKASIICIKV